MEQLECDPLCGVVTGMEHSGTTLLSQLLHAHPDVASGPECGLLLSRVSDFDQIEPFWSWLCGDRGWSWCLTEQDREALLGAGSYREAYRLLAGRMGRANKDERLRKLFADASIIYDKTPAYVHQLEDIVAKVQAPFVITLKTWEEQVASHLKRSNTLAGFGGVYINAVKNIASVAKTYPSRVLVVNYRSLTCETEKVMQKVAEFFSLPGASRLSLQAYNERYGFLISSGNSFTHDRIVYSEPFIELPDKREVKRFRKVPGKIKRELAFLDKVAI